MSKAFKHLRGTSIKCSMCHRTFIITTTYKYCPECSYVMDPKNYKLLSKRDKALRNKENYKRWPETYRIKDSYQKYQKTLRSKNKKLHYVPNKLAEKKKNEASKIQATNSKRKWKTKEVEFLRKNAKIMTTLEIAFELRRTYSSVMSKAFASGITLQTPEKTKGTKRTSRLVKLIMSSKESQVRQMVMEERRH